MNAGLAIGTAPLLQHKPAHLKNQVTGQNRAGKEINPRRIQDIHLKIS
ncbi:hypothetical protein SRABI04_02253 [Chryseobacterium sp. Bi04]|nr:hypothetical protein SRABI04_02253 [Chryseobacterium sp. Bi04]